MPGNNHVTHTPGPWKAADQGEGKRGKTLGICISGGNGMPLFFVPRGTPTSEANARLIAAAPDLLNASKTLLERIDCDPFRDIAGVPSGIQRAKNAIAKAEGRE